MFGVLKKKVKGFFKKEEKVIEEKLEQAPEEEILEEGPEETVLEEEQPEPEQEVQEKKTPEKKAQPPVPKKAEKEKKVRLSTRLKKKVARKIVIKEEDIAPLLEDFELELLEADVSLETAEKITRKLREKLSGKEIRSKESISGVLEKALRETLLELLPERIDILSADKKPFVIMVVGPNGHGKTTTIIKLAKKIQDQGKKVVIAAADTFRAASIEQLETLARKIGVNVIKHEYGADPAAVCYDAISHAKARGVDYVILDTAGRSELNKNLMEELRKINRVAKPDARIYVGESLAGNAAVEEAKKFDEAVPVDGIIMTKADCDVKGGSIISVSSTLEKPILFLGVGQGLDDLKEFNPPELVDKILGEED